jgi:hypothetical protein
MIRRLLVVVLLPMFIIGGSASFRPTQSASTEQCTQDPEVCLTHVLVKMDSIKPGMTGGDLGNSPLRNRPLEVCWRSLRTRNWMFICYVCGIREPEAPSFNQIMKTRQYLPIHLQVPSRVGFFNLHDLPQFNMGMAVRPWTGINT